MSDPQSVQPRSYHPLPQGYEPDTPPSPSRMGGSRSGGASATAPRASTRVLSNDPEAGGQCGLGDTSATEGVAELYYSDEGETDEGLFYPDESPPATRALVSQYQTRCPSAPSAESAVLGAAVAAGVLVDCEAAQGPSRHDLALSQRVTLSEGLEGLSDKAKGELQSQAIGYLAEFSASAAMRGLAGASLALTGPLMTAYELGKQWAQAAEDGQALAGAARRDTVHWSFVVAAGTALPESYRSSLRERYSASVSTVSDSTGVLSGRPSRVLTPLMAEGSSFQEVRDEAARAVNEGRALAQTRGLDSQQALDQALATDAGFRERYREMGIFHGVNSHVFQRTLGYED